MKESLLELTCCPACLGELSLKVAEIDADRVKAGTLTCKECGREYPIRAGLPDLIARDRLDPHKAAEMQGWVDLWRKKGMYDQPTIEDSFRLPYVGHIWVETAQMFDMALAEMDLKGGETILDLGAGQGWAGRYFAEKGCRVVCADIVDDEWYGLGRAFAIMDHFGVYYEPVVADGELLPLRSGRFDIVYFAGALHHFRDPSLVLRQAIRVLKPGGRLLASSEPSRGLLQREQDHWDEIEEVDHGIVERRPTLVEYERAARKEGFRDVRIDTFQTYQSKPSEVRGYLAWVRERLWLGVRPVAKPLTWCFMSLVMLLPPKLAGRIAFTIQGGNAFIRAAKPFKDAAA